MLVESSTMAVKKHIDNEQPATVHKHFETLIAETSSISQTSTDLTFQDLPEWYDEKLFTMGQNYYQRNLLAMGAVSLLGVLSVIIIPTILKVLVWTKQSGTTCTAFKRYLETLIHIHSLYIADINDPKSRWWKSINVIRFKHATSSRRSGQAGAGEILQRDMALTQFGFMGYALLAPEKFGLTNEPKEREGLNHFWRVVGNVLGISDKLNIARKNEVQTTELCRKLLDEVYVKHMKDQPEKFEMMSRVLLDGMWYVDPSLDSDTLLYFWYNISGIKYKKSLSFRSQLNYCYRVGIVILLRIPVVGFFTRNFFNGYMRVCYWIAEKSPILAWIRFGKAQTQIHLYPSSK